MELNSIIWDSLIGTRISSVSEDGSTLTLEDGTTLELYESEQDCCACAYGKWELLDPERLDAAITSVEMLTEHHNDGDTPVGTAKISIYHNQNRIALGDGYADGGNGGYYYSALSLRVKRGNQVVQQEILTPDEYH